MKVISGKKQEKRAGWTFQQNDGAGCGQGEEKHFQKELDKEVEKERVGEKGETCTYRRDGREGIRKERRDRRDRRDSTETVSDSDHE